MDENGNYKDFQHQLQIANQKHDVVAIQVYDPRAKVLPDVGLLKVMDWNSDTVVFIFSRYNSSLITGNKDIRHPARNMSKRRNNAIRLRIFVSPQ